MVLSIEVKDEKAAAFLEAVRHLDGFLNVGKVEDTLTCVEKYPDVRRKIG